MGKARRGEVHTEFWWGDLKERGHLEEVGVDGIVMLRWILKKSFGGTSTGLT